MNDKITHRHMTSYCWAYVQSLGTKVTVQCSGRPEVPACGEPISGVDSLSWSDLNWYGMEKSVKTGHWPTCPRCLVMLDPYVELLKP